MTETRILTSFESSSVRCLTRQEESLLQAALVMTIVKKRFQERQERRKKKQQPRNYCTGSRVEAVFALPRPTKLLSTSLPDHMDHMVQVAGRLQGRTLEGVACHLVQQLDSWILQLHQGVAARQRHREKPLDAATTGITAVTHAVLNETTGTDLTPARQHDGATTTTTLLRRSQNKKEPDLTPIHDWMAKSLLSFSPHQASSTEVFHAIILQSDKKELMDCWWHVLAKLIHQVDHGTLPQSSPAGALSLDHFAVTLLELLQTLATRTMSFQRQQDDPYPTSSTMIIPPLLQELLVPLPTPTNLTELLWNLADHVSAASRRQAPTFLSPGAKLLLRLGLCRTLLFPTETPPVSGPPLSAPWNTPRNNNQGLLGTPGNNNYY